MAKIKRGDLVEVITGSREDRGKQGRVIEVFPDRNRVLVQGVNYVKRHVRQDRNQRNVKTGGIETHEAPIHVSNVAIVDPGTKRPTRVGFRLEEVVKGGVRKTVRVRYAKKSGKDLSDKESNS